ncbi:MAG: acetylxylan esterase [Vicinamibacteraceae bacterium]
MRIGSLRVAFGALLLAASAASLSAKAPGGPAAAGRAQEKAAAQSAAAQAALIANLNAIGFAQLDQRVTTMAAITTRADAEKRQRHVRQVVGELVGGVPRPPVGRVVAKRFGTVEDDGFRVENVAYESVPGYWVTANVYVPAGAGPFPALVVAPGHGAGKASQYSWAANFARAGFLTLAIDPMGQGERMQHFDPELGASKVEPSGEHEHGNQTSLLVGQHIARYWFADGVRSVDYLTQRPDVDAARIGTFGCSGGGTAAAYLVATDPRVKAAAIASFITSFKTLMPGNGPQDAEQTLPRFIASGLDFADWVELAAPRRGQSPSWPSRPTFSRSPAPRTPSRKRSASMGCSAPPTPSS